MNLKKLCLMAQGGFPVVVTKLEELIKMLIFFIMNNLLTNEDET